jgi:hypothetical protein
LNAGFVGLVVNGAITLAAMATAGSTQPGEVKLEEDYMDGP